MTVFIPPIPHFKHALHKPDLRFAGLEADPYEPNPYDPPGQKSDYFLDSNLFRDPGIWNPVSRAIASKFSQHAPHIVIHGVSDGSDAYSLVIALQEAGFNLQKPIVAKDLSQTLTQQNQTGQYHLSHLDKQCFRQYHAEKPLSDYYDATTQTFKPLIRNQIHFKQGDILADTAQPLPAHTVLMFRNAVYWLPPEQRSQLALQLSQSMQPGSLLVLGELPEDEAFGQVLSQLGFRSLAGSYLYEKVSTPNRHAAQQTLQKDAMAQKLSVGQGGPLAWD